MKRLASLLLCAALLAVPLFSLAACAGSPAAPAERVPIVIDADPGIDDAVALLCAAASDRLDIRGITAVHGNVPVGKTALNALKLACFLGLDCPVSVGADTALDGGTASAASVHGANGLGGIALSPPTRDFDKRDAVQLLYDCAVQADGELRILALGALTNIAQLLRQHPDAADLIAGITLMGGTRGEGNMSAYGEFNMFCDPEAASVVFDSGVPITMVGLDATNQSAWVTAEQLRGMITGENRAAPLLAGIAEYLETQNPEGGQGKTLHDALAAACLIEPDFAQMTQARVTVDPHADSRHRGQTVVTEDENGNVRVCEPVERAVFREFLAGCAAAYEGPADAAPQATAAAGLTEEEVSLYPHLLREGETPWGALVSGQPVTLTGGEGGDFVLESLFYLVTGELFAILRPSDTAIIASLSGTLALQQGGKSLSLHQVDSFFANSDFYLIYQGAAPDGFVPQQGCSLTLGEWEADLGPLEDAPLERIAYEPDGRKTSFVELVPGGRLFYLAGPQLGGLTANCTDGRAYDVFSSALTAGTGGGHMPILLCVADLPQSGAIASLEYENFLQKFVSEEACVLNLKELPQQINVDGLNITLKGAEQVEDTLRLFPPDGETEQVEHLFYAVNYDPLPDAGRITKMTVHPRLNVSCGWGGLTSPNTVLVPSGEGLSDLSDDALPVDITVTVSHGGPGFYFLPD